MQRACCLLTSLSIIRFYNFVSSTLMLVFLLKNIMANVRQRSPRRPRSSESSRAVLAAGSSRAVLVAEATPRRRRRDAATVRAAISDAAERRLVSAGPSGIRLQEVAADVGISHPNVLHHFKSRQGLVVAVIARAMDALHRELVEAISASSGASVELASILDNVWSVLADKGYGRVILWLALEGDMVEHESRSLRRVVDATHALRRAKARDKRKVLPRADSAFVVMLVALALSGSSALAPSLQKDVGLPDDEATHKKFRAWLANLVVEHLDLGA